MIGCRDSSGNLRLESLIPPGRDYTGWGIVTRHAPTDPPRATGVVVASLFVAWRLPTLKVDVSIAPEGSPCWLPVSDG